MLLNLACPPENPLLVSLDPVQSHDDVDPRILRIRRPSLRHEKQLPLLDRSALGRPLVHGASSLPVVLEAPDARVLRPLHLPSAPLDDQVAIGKRRDQQVGDAELLGQAVRHPHGETEDVLTAAPVQAGIFEPHTRVDARPTPAGTVVLSRVEELGSRLGRVPGAPHQLEREVVDPEGRHVAQARRLRDHAHDAV